MSLKKTEFLFLSHSDEQGLGSYGVFAAVTHYFLIAFRGCSPRAVPHAGICSQGQEVMGQALWSQLS